MVFIGSVSSFVKFGGQTSKNIRNVCLEMTFCVLTCFTEFYLFFMDKVNVGGPKIVYKYILLGKILENILKDHLRVLEKGPKTVGMAVPGRP